MICMEVDGVKKVLFKVLIPLAVTGVILCAVRQGNLIYSCTGYWRVFRLA